MDFKRGKNVFFLLHYCKTFSFVLRGTGNLERPVSDLNKDRENLRKTTMCQEICSPPNPLNVLCNFTSQHGKSFLGF